MTKIDKAIEDVRDNITFQYNEKAEVTQWEILLLLEEKKEKEKKQEDVIQNMAEYILKHSKHCPIPVAIKCNYEFQKDGCVKCFINHMYKLKEMNK